MCRCGSCGEGVGGMRSCGGLPNIVEMLGGANVCIHYKSVEDEGKRGDVEVGVLWRMLHRFVRGGVLWSCGRSVLCRCCGGE